VVEGGERLPWLPESENCQLAEVSEEAWTLFKVAMVT
jgi:hypothetical protein